MAELINYIAALINTLLSLYYGWNNNFSKASYFIGAACLSLLLNVLLGMS